LIEVVALLAVPISGRALAVAVALAADNSASVAEFSGAAFADATRSSI
jgi:hypothetical protein